MSERVFNSFATALDLPSDRSSVTMNIGAFRCFHLCRSLSVILFVFLAVSLAHNFLARSGPFPSIEWTHLSSSKGDVHAIQWNDIQPHATRQLVLPTTDVKNLCV